MENKKTLEDEFFALHPEERRLIHISLCEHALDKWNLYAKSHDKIEYQETVTGTPQVVDKQLPSDSLTSAKQGFDSLDVSARYREPITAMHDEDLVLPENISFAYYAIYNLFQKYGEKKDIEDWLIVNQAISSDSNSDMWNILLKNAIQKAK